MGRGTNVWFMVWMRGGTSEWFVVAHDKANGRWELQGLMKHDKLGDMGCLVPMKKEVY
jgi:hypothetical protein